MYNGGAGRSIRSGSKVTSSDKQTISKSEVIGIIDKNINCAAFRFSGHQTFPLRIAWIPKVVRELENNQDPLTDIDEGITRLGLGKNMVEALRCWLEAFQIAHKKNVKWELTQIGKTIFSPSSGLDPYLDDSSTCWLLHWLISTNTEAPFFAWECIFNRWPTMEFTPSAVLAEFVKETTRNSRPASVVTLKQHWDVFLHSYRQSQSGRGEDHLDSALSVLGLIREVGERQNAEGKWETLYSFDVAHRTSLPQQLFAYFLHQWWNKYYPLELTIPLREVMSGRHSPGRILRMQEQEILHRVEHLSRSEEKILQVVESNSLRQLRRDGKPPMSHWLQAAYDSPTYL